jgi:hypothetical protein
MEVRTCDRCNCGERTVHTIMFPRMRVENVYANVYAQGDLVKTIEKELELTETDLCEEHFKQFLDTVRKYKTI